VTKLYPEEWLQSAEREYKAFLAAEGKRISNGNYFVKGWPEAKQFKDRRRANKMTEECGRYNNLLWPTYVNILDHIEENLDRYKGLRFLDNGCGTGLFSVFLKKIGISCYNYDNLDQIGQEPISFKEELKVNTTVPEEADVLMTSGIWVDAENFEHLNLKSIMADENHTKSVAPLVEKNNLKLKAGMKSCMIYE
jgi:hypothetical protein